MRVFSSVVLLLCSIVLLAGCDSSGPELLPGQVRTAEVKLGQTTFTLEVADTVASRQRGLMYRQSMPADRGMLFVFDYPEELRFWMKNTYIPLDIIYLDGQGRVVSIKQMQPLDTTSVSSDKPAKFAIEINAGMASKSGVKVDDLVAIPKL